MVLELPRLTSHWMHISLQIIKKNEYTCAKAHGSTHRLINFVHCVGKENYFPKLSLEIEVLVQIMKYNLSKTIIRPY